jgi:hypothetical protein
MDWGGNSALGGVGESSMNSRDHSSSGMYPPSMYDTSVSSKSSASRRSPMHHHLSRNSPTQRYYQQQQQHHQQQPETPSPVQKGLYQERPVVVNPSRSLDSYEYPPRYSIAMSDQGGPISSSSPKLMQTHSDIGDSRYYPINNNNNNNNSSSTHQNHSHSLATTTSSDETRLISGRGRGKTLHPASYGLRSISSDNNNNSGIINVSARSSSIRNHNLNGRSVGNFMPLDETDIQAHLSESGSFGSYSRQFQQHQARSSSHNPSLHHVEEQAGQDDLTRHQTSTHPNDSDRNNSARIETPSPVNVKQLKRQLWNEKEVLQVAVPPSSLGRTLTENVPNGENWHVRPQQDPPQTWPTRYLASHRSFHDSDPNSKRTPNPIQHQEHSFANSRYARSLSPSRRNQSNPTSNDIPPTVIPYASSTISDNANTKFHAKFYEAALVARMRGKMAPFSTTHSSLPSHTGSFSRQALLEERATKTSLQRKLEGHTRSDVSFQPPTLYQATSTEESNSTRLETHPTQTQKRQQQEEFIPKKPQNIERVTTDLSEQQRYHSSNYNTKTGKHDGDMQTAAPEKNTDPPRRLGRVPSPMIQDRIRSLSQDRQSPKTLGYSQSSSLYRHETELEDSSPIDHCHDPYETNVGEEHFREMPRYPTRDVSMKGREHPMKETAPTTVVPQQSSVPSNYTERRASPLATSGKEFSKERMAQLMARLNSVNRDNPETALAQIDQILRQESHASSPVRRSVNDYEGSPQQHEFAMTAPVPPFSSTSEKKSSEDDDTDVSSITNPTYQGTPSSKSYSERVRVVSPLESKAFPKMTSPGEEHGTSPKLIFNPSTSSFRRPRPSHLQNYAIMPSMPHDYAALDHAFGLFDTRQQWSSGMQASPKMIEHDPTLVTTGFTKNPFGDFILPLAEQPETQQQQQPPEPKEEINQQTNVGLPYDERSPSRRADLSTEVNTAKVSHAPPEDAHGKTGKLDTFITDKEALARKIKAWDTLSNSIGRSEPDTNRGDTAVGYSNQSSASLPRPPHSKYRRHPWDGKLPSRLENIKMRDTSMDEAIGIEAEMTSRGVPHDRDTLSYRKDLESSQVSESNGDDKVERDHFKQSRQNIRSRAEEYLPVDPVYHIEQKVDEEKKAVDEEPLGMSDIPVENTTSKKSTRNVIESPEGGLLFRPRNQQYSQFSNRQTMKQRLSEDESSWVSIPPTTFFSDLNKTLSDFVESNTTSKKQKPLQQASNVQETPKSTSPGRRKSLVRNRHVAAEAQSAKLKRHGPTNAGPVDVDDYTFGVRTSPSLDQSGEQAEIEVALTDPKRYVGHKSNGVAVSRSGAMSLACQTIRNVDDRSQEKKKGFLRAFIERKKKKETGSATVGHAASAASVAAHSSSLESHGAKTFSNADLTPPATSAIRLMPPPPGVMDRRALTPSRRGSRCSNKAPSRRARSNSLERFRTPSMAQKFSQVMKLYEDET